MRHHDPDDVLADREPSPPNPYIFDPAAAIPDPCPPISPNRDVIDGMRAAADWLESHPEIECGSDVEFHVFPKSLQQIARSSYGSLKKCAAGNWFYLVKSFGPKVSIHWNQERDKVCVKRVVGTRTLPAQPERTEEIVEWDCPPILRDAPEPLPVDPHEDLDDDFQLDPDQCAECDQTAVGYDEGTPFCAAHYAARPRA